MSVAFDKLIRELAAARPSLSLRENEPMSRHTSFRIGGPVRLLALPQGTEELAWLCRALAGYGVRPILLGNGTNVLFPDEGLERVVVKTVPGVGELRVDGTRLTVGAGVTLAQAASAAQAAGLAGMEFAHGIPGSVGGGVVMNAGAYGGELKDIAVETEYLDGDLVTRSLLGSEHEFSYRRSFFSSHPGIVLRTVFSLSPGDPGAIASKMRELADKRRASQPLDMPSAGSTFKRPANGYAAALIDQAGLRGFQIGGARVSEKHAGFVVNAGGATCGDVLRLMEHVRSVVLADAGVELEPEVRIIGNTDDDT